MILNTNGKSGGGFQKIKEWTLTAANAESGAWTLDLSDIDWSKWERVHLDFGGSRNNTSVWCASTPLTKSGKEASMIYTEYGSTNGSSNFPLNMGLNQISWADRGTFQPGRIPSRNVTATYPNGRIRSSDSSNKLSYENFGAIRVSVSGAGGNISNINEVRVILWGEA